MPELLINGAAGEQIAASDRGLHYGDGLFETLQVRDGAMPLWARHWRRLSDGCGRLGIQGVQEGVLRAEAERLCSGHARAVIKIIVTRGCSGRGYRAPPHGEATRVIARHDWPAHPAAHWREGVAVRVCATPLGRNAALAGMKHLNRLEQVIARREWSDDGIAEGLMLDDRGQVIAGTMSNLFAVMDGRVLTPPVRECGVAGVMRGLLLEWSGAVEQALTLHALTTAQEAFLCNAVIGIWPVRSIAKQAYPVGEVARGLMARLVREGLLDPL